MLVGVGLAGVVEMVAWVMMSMTGMGGGWH